MTTEQAERLRIHIWQIKESLLIMQQNVETEESLKAMMQIVDLLKKIYELEKL